MACGTAMGLVSSRCCVSGQGFPHIRGPFKAKWAIGRRASTHAPRFVMRQNDCPDRHPLGRSSRTKVEGSSRSFWPSPSVCLGFGSKLMPEAQRTHDAKLSGGSRFV